MALSFQIQPYTRAQAAGHTFRVSGPSCPFTVDSPICEGVHLFIAPR